MFFDTAHPVLTQTNSITTQYELTTTYSLYAISTNYVLRIHSVLTHY